MPLLVTRIGTVIFPLILTLGIVADTINRFWKERHPETPKPVPAAKAHDKKKSLAEPAKRIELRPESQFRIYHPAPVVAINPFGTVRWVADGRQHKAGQLLKPRVFQGKLTVRFRHEGEQVERLVGHMLETVGWLKRRAKKKASE